MTHHIEMLNVLAWYLPKGETLPEKTFNWNEKKKDVFWASGCVFFDNPARLIMPVPELAQVIPVVNLYRFECGTVAQNHPGPSLLGIEIEDRWASDSIAHDLPIFQAATHRNQEAISTMVPAMFTLVYEVYESSRYTVDGTDVDIEYTCLGELDFSRIAEVCIRPEVATS